MAKHSFERTYAPHVDPAWTEAFILEARLRDLSGAQIGDALAEVDAHVVDAGEPAHEAFGNPKTYAAELATSASPVVEQHFGRTLIPVGLQVVGMMLALTAAAHLGDGAPFELDGGFLASLVFILLVIAAVGVWSSAVLRVLLERLWVGALFMLVALAVIVAAAFLPGVAATMHVGWPLAIAAILLVAGTLLQLGPWRRAVEADEIVAPDGTRARATRAAGLGSALMIPVATLVLGTAFALLG